MNPSIEENDNFHYLTNNLKFENKIVFSICVLFYNQANTVESCLNSIIAQNLNYKSFQIVIVNDGSVDETDSVIQKYITNHKNINIKYIKHKENMGVFEARRTCINNADGQYIIFVDGDDEFVENEFGNWVHEIFLVEPCIGTIDIYFTGRTLSYRTQNPKKTDFEQYYRATGYHGHYMQGSDEYKQIVHNICNNDREAWKIFGFLTGNVIKTSACKFVIQRLNKQYRDFNYNEDICMMYLLLDTVNHIYVNVKDRSYKFYKFFDFLMNAKSLIGNYFSNNFTQKKFDETKILIAFKNLITAHNIVSKYCNNFNFKDKIFNMTIDTFYIALAQTQAYKIDKSNLQIFIRKLLTIISKSPEIKKTISGFVSSPILSKELEYKLEHLRVLF